MDVPDRRARCQAVKKIGARRKLNATWPVDEQRPLREWTASSGIITSLRKHLQQSVWLLVLITGADAAVNTTP